jgi:hypothetical protein
MATVSPVMADAFRLLRQDLYHHLDEAEFLALKYDEWTEKDSDAARELIPDLVLVIRGMLIDHKIRPDGDCRTCASAWPCPVVALIHGLVKDPERQFVALANRADDAE